MKRVVFISVWLAVLLAALFVGDWNTWPIVRSLVGFVAGTGVLSCLPLRTVTRWTMIGGLGLLLQVYIAKLATETEKDPDLEETRQFTKETYPAVAAEITAENMQRHIDALSAIPSRFTGTPGCDTAAEYVMQQFRALDVGEPQVQEFPVTVPVFDRAEVQTDVGVFPLHPIYPNGICPAAVSKEGLRTRLVYAGFGRLASVNGKELDGATVVVETGGREQWLYLIDLGARAIIFVENERPPLYMAFVTQTLSHQDVPRFWMTKTEAALLLAELKTRDLDATVLSDVRWEERTGKNIWVDIPGVSTAEHNRTEVVVLSAYYDSSSFVPDLAPGAEQACSIATLFELGKLIKKHRFEKTVRLLATSGHFEALEGVRRYVWEHVGQYDTPMRDVSPQDHAAFLGLDLSAGTQRVALFYLGFFSLQQANNIKPRVSDLGRRASRYVGEIASALNLPKDVIFVDTINPAEGKDWPTYMPASLALEHEAALLAGIPALSFATANDTRFFTGSPCDTTVNMDNLVAQARLLACLLPNAFNVAGRYTKRSMPRSICRVSGQAVSFDAREGYLPSKPLEHALVMGRRQTDWFSKAGVLTRMVTTADENGMFEFVGLETETELWQKRTALAFEPFLVEEGHITWAPDFGQLGKANYPITVLPIQKQMELMCVAFKCKTLDIYNLIDPRSYNTLNTLQVLEAASNSPPAMYGTTLVEPTWFGFWAPTASVYAEAGERLKVTAAAGATQKRMLFLNVPEQPPEEELFNTGQGFNVDETPAVYRTYLQSARDVWRMDESRVRFFRSHGIENARVNTLHDMAGKAIERSERSLAEKNYQDYFIEARRALSLESRAYPDVVGMANDVVRGLVFYLVLLLPFAFATERLFVAGRRIETRILGIIAMFLGMFVLLRVTHPAFQIVFSPMVVLLGFCIATLSTVIISIVMAKLEALVSQRKIAQQGEHESGVQVISGFALALELGIANMRRRKVRTVLTSITLTVLTFSVLSFASVTAQLRTQRYAYKEGATPYKGVLLRTPNWMPLPFETYASLRNELEDTCTLAPRRWYYGALVINQSFIDMRHGNKLLPATALAGLTAQEQQFMDVKRALIGGSRWLTPEVPGQEPPEELLLPINFVTEFTGVESLSASEEEKVRLVNAFLGQKVTLLGRDFTVIGVFDWEKMNELVDIDGEELTPYNPVEMEKKNQEQGTPDPEEVQRFIHHSFKQVPIVSERVLGYLGGDLRSVAILPDKPAELEPMLESLVRRTDYVLFANMNGVPTLLSNRNATRISELWNLVILMVIAGLIVFNTMLGSVFERTKEIATYTALGIAPSHIGRLFLVEASVFAVLGVMAGYVLGQGVSRMTHVFQVPVLNALNLNYSSLAGVGACVLVMGMVMLSSLYPSRKATELGVPDIDRRWKLPSTKEARIRLQLPFTVSLREAPGLVAFLKEFLDSHIDVSVGNFYVENVKAGPGVTGGHGTGVTAQFWLTPFDLGVSQYATFALGLLADMGVCGVHVDIERLSGDASSWRRANGRFMTGMREQFLIWRNLKPEARAEYVARGKEYVISDAGVGASPGAQTVLET